MSEIKVQEPLKQENEGIDWASYARAYDVIPDLFPEYQANQKILQRVVESMPETPKRILDLGAGTGNYICGMSHYLPDAKFTHLDGSPAMNLVAREKYDAQSLEVSIIEDYVQSANLDANSFDLIICINALYAMLPPEETIQKIRQWLQPGGTFFVIDFGRKQRLSNWLGGLAKNAITGKIPGHAWKKLVTEVPTVFSQGLKGTKGQSDGVYWTHSTEEFGAFLTNQGLEVKELGICFRDFCDYAVSVNPCVRDTS